MKSKIKAGIIGAAGYTGGELLRLLLHHPNAEIAYAVSKSRAGKPVHDVHTDLLGDTAMEFSATPSEEADAVFLCLPHGESKAFLQQHPFLLKSKVIDLSRDFRLTNPQNGFVYGLPELNREKMAAAKHIANPGCFATAIQLALLPLASEGLLTDEIHVNATTGSTGAGQSPSETTHFTWRNNNLSVYKAFEHEHLPEIRQSLQSLQQNFVSDITFIPQRGSFTRGILAGVTVDCALSEKNVNRLYAEYYANHPFVHLTGNADVKQVSNTNKCFIQLIRHKNKLAVVTVIDNLLKGASGQAIQNMNLLFGFPETSGLKLKANVF